MLQRKRSLEDELYRVGCFFLIFGSMAVVFYFRWILPNFKMPPCMFHEMFGIYCPGCGGTRAVVALLKGQLLKSLWYHPLVLYTVVIFGGFMLTQSLERLGVRRIRGWKFHSWHLYGAVTVLGLNFVVKNILLLCFRVEL